MNDVIIKYNYSGVYENYWELSGVKFREIYKILNTSSRILLLWHRYKTKNMTNEFVVLDDKEIDYLLKDRIDLYPDLLCIDCNNRIFDILQDGKIRDVLSRLIHDSTLPISQSIPTVNNNYLVYTHDDGQYVCIWTKNSKIVFLEKLICGLLHRRGIYKKIDVNSYEFGELCRMIDNGILINTEFWEDQDNSYVFFYLHQYANSDNWVDMLWDNGKNLKMEVYSLKLQ